MNRRTENVGRVYAEYGSVWIRCMLNNGDQEDHSILNISGINYKTPDAYGHPIPVVPAVDCNYIADLAAKHLNKVRRFDRREVDV